MRVTKNRASGTGSQSLCAAFAESCSAAWGYVLWWVYNTGRSFLLGRCEKVPHILSTMHGMPSCTYVQCLFMFNQQQFPTHNPAQLNQQSNPIGPLWVNLFSAARLHTAARNIISQTWPGGNNASCYGMYPRQLISWARDAVGWGFVEFWIEIYVGC